MSAERAKLEREFVKAVKHGDAEKVRAWVQSDPGLLALRDDENATPLHHAAWKGHAAVAAVLLDAGADVNTQSTGSHYGGTPLHAAAHGNQKAVAELLLQRGADAAAQSCNGRTPLDETTFHNASAVANLLKKYLG